jgi:hypothetical protein
LSLITVAETTAFQRKIKALLSEREKEDLINYLAQQPRAGTVLQRTGGIRKLRWAQAGRGKSGSIRVVYLFHSEWMPLYLLAAFGKNEKANLSRAERNALATAVRQLVATWRRRNEQGLH